MPLQEVLSHPPWKRPAVQSEEGWLKPIDVLQAGPLDCYFLREQRAGADDSEGPGMTLAEMKEERDKPVVIVDGQGVVTYVNSAFQRRLGWRPSQLLGQSLTAIIPKYLRDAHNLGFSRFLTAEKATLLNRPLHLKALNGRGEEILAEHFIVAEKIEGEWMFAATIEPVQTSG